MSTLRRAADFICLGALIFALFLRAFAAQWFWGGFAGAQWALFVALTLVFLRLAFTVSDALSRKVPWGRLVLPAVVLFGLLRVASGKASRLQGQATLLALEAGFIAGAALFVTLRWQKFKEIDHLEDVFEEVFLQFLPLPISRMAARELVLLWEGLRWCLRGFRLNAPPGFGYVEESYIKMLPLLIVMGLFTEGIAYELLMHKHPLVRLVVHVLEVWAVLWCFGLYATMKLRPHQIAPEWVRLRCGVFSSCEFNPQCLLDVQPESPEEPQPRNKNLARITARGAPVLQLSFKEPVFVQRTFAGPRAFKRILVSADDPAAFRNALLAAEKSANRVESLTSKA